MKYGKSVYNQIEGAIPSWKDYFLSYKDLKKKLKLMGISDEQFDFIMLLDAEVDKFNEFFEDKQEDYVITIEKFKESVGRANELSAAELLKLRNDIVNFHGEMVLLQNYSAFNFIGLVKILKKYDKRTGALMRLPFIQKVLEQPFFTMDLLQDLIKQCLDLLDSLFPSVQSRDRAEPSNPEYMDNLHMRSAVYALRILKEIRSGSSTKSDFSLPPFENP